MTSTDYFHSSLRLTEILLSIIGLKPYYTEVTDNYKEFAKKNSLYLMSFGVLSICVVGEFLYLFKSWGDFSNFLDVTALAPCICFCILALAKMWTVSRSREKLTSIFEALKEIWPTDLVRGNERDAVYTYLREVKVVTTGFTVMFLVLIWMYNLFPLGVMLYDYCTLGTMTNELPYFIWYPFDPFKEPVFELLYFIQVWAGCIAAIAILGPDCLFCVITTHLCMHFRLLSLQLTAIVQTRERERGNYSTTDNDRCNAKTLPSMGLMINSYDHKATNAILKTCLERHIQLIGLATEFEQIFSPSILINFIASSFIICFVGFQATAVLEVELAKFILFLISSLAQTLILCWYGTQLIENSSGLSEAAYNSSWYVADPRMKRSLLILMIRSQRPQKLTAFKFSILSVGSFTSILSTSYSYFALLRKLYNPDSSNK